MGQLLQPFDATQFDPTQGASKLPVGRHPVIIESSSVETTKAGDSGMVVFGLRIIDGPCKGMSGPYRLNLYHTNAKTSEIAHRQLSALCHVTGRYRIMKTDDLHDAPFIIEVALQDGEEAREKGYTEVKRVFDMNGVEPGKTGQQMAQPQGQPQQQPQQQQPAAAAWGGQQPAQQQQPQGQQPAAAAWGQPAQGQQPPQQQQPAQAAAWGGAAPAQAPAAAPAPWGAGGGQQPAQGQPAAWNQQPAAQGGQPWAQR